MKTVLLFCCGAAVGVSLGCDTPPSENSTGSTTEALEPFSFLIDWQAEPTSSPPF